MSRPLRIGCVPYLNGVPLVEGLRDVIFRPPPRLGELLAAGRLDVAMTSAIDVLRRRWAHVPGIAIASRGRIDSVRLHHAVAIPRIRRVALDRNSHTSNVLARILLERRFGLRPAYVMRNPSRGLSFRNVDAAVTIGDTSFRSWGVPFLDLGAEWMAFTGRPFVYALWGYRADHPRAREIAAELRAAKERGMAKLDAIARREAPRRGLSVRLCREYLAECLTFDLGPAERAGLRLFGKYASQLAVEP